MGGESKTAERVCMCVSVFKNGKLVNGGDFWQDLCVPMADLEVVA